MCEATIYCVNVHMLIKAINADWPELPWHIHINILGQNVS